MQRAVVMALISLLFTGCVVARRSSDDYLLLTLPRPNVAGMAVATLALSTARTLAMPIQPL